MKSLTFHYWEFYYEVNSETVYYSQCRFLIDILMSYTCIYQKYLQQWTQTESKQYNFRQSPLQAHQHIGAMAFRL